MEIIVAKKAGFCFGVKRAIKAAYKTAREAQSGVNTLGPLIHNPQVVSHLEEMNVRAIDRLDEFCGNALIIRSHGVPKSVFEAVRNAGIHVVDATCPFVKNAQDFASQLHKEGYRVVIVGDESHPEVQGIKAYAGEAAIVASDAADLADLDKSRKIGIVVQTTTTMEKFKAVVDRCLEIASEVKIFNTICDATHVRQEEAQEIARRADIMLVVGGKNSGNTSRLAELCRETGTDTYHIETFEEIDPGWFHDAGKVGITAGASTPDWIIEAVIACLEQISPAGKERKGIRKSSRKLK
jgi:4-hydroxy-3-methylbut-2-enyl diphosphate reductase